MIPFTTAERKVLGVAAPSQQQVAQLRFIRRRRNPYGIQPRLTGYVNQIYVQADRAADSCSRRSARSPNILVRRHHIRPGDHNDFSVRNLSQIASAAEGSSQTMALLLAAVASISLLVGGIGIMNILLVSVTERTREIGLRMAIGAAATHVLLQFLAEAVILERRRRHRRHHRAGSSLPRSISVVAGWPTPISLAADRRRLSVLGRGRHVLRLLSGTQGGQPRSDRGAAIRVTAQGGTSASRASGPAGTVSNVGISKGLAWPKPHNAGGKAPQYSPSSTGVDNTTHLHRVTPKAALPQVIAVRLTPHGNVSFNFEFENRIGDRHWLADLFRIFLGSLQPAAIMPKIEHSSAAAP